MIELVIAIPIVKFKRLLEVGIEIRNNFQPRAKVTIEEIKNKGK
jgi:hypothetical protein